MTFRDREDAGRRLAFALRAHRGEKPMVLGLPRGVVVAYEVASALAADLDVWVVRKLGAPGQEELAIGAVAEGGEVVLNEEVMAHVGATSEVFATAVARKEAEVRERVRALRGKRPPPQVAGRTVIVVDDGIATGATTRAAVRAIRRRGPKHLVLAVPVAAAATLASLRPEVDEVVCLDADPDLFAIGEYYADFAQTTDADVATLLARIRTETRDSEEETMAAVDLDVEIPVDDVQLTGNLVVPSGATGLVVFAHGSGSSRSSPRNRFVARRLEQAGLGTLLLDLLTPDEEGEDELAAGALRFDIELLAARLLGAAEWARAQPEAAHLQLGYFGASTGAGAALVAAAARPDLVGAVVSRGGRVDLAGASIARVAAPTLLVVGAADAEVLGWNRQVLSALRCPRELVVVARATHLFPEPGALEDVARVAQEWFCRYLTAPTLRATG